MDILAITVLVASVVLSLRLRAKWPALVVGAAGVVLAAAGWLSERGQSERRQPARVVEHVVFGRIATREDALSGATACAPGTPLTTCKALIAGLEWNRRSFATTVSFPIETGAFRGVGLREPSAGQVERMLYFGSEAAEAARSLLTQKLGPPRQDGDCVRWAGATTLDLCERTPSPVLATLRASGDPGSADRREVWRDLATSLAEEHKVR